MFKLCTEFWNCVCILVLTKVKLADKRIWCSGIIVPSHGTDQGSIPWMRNFFSWKMYIYTYFFVYVFPTDSEFA